MKKIEITYNPYLLTTKILVDERPPKENSSLIVGKKRLQEWVDRLPKILYEEYRDCNLSIKFKGSMSDYDDVKAAFEKDEKMKADLILEKVADIDDVEKNIERIFAEIQAGPISELKTPAIIEAFERAKNSRFEINVVATMSAGKSTLINALLGKSLMPAANQATTATIVKIIDSDQDGFSATAFDKSGIKIKELENVEEKDMKQLNDDENVSELEIRGKIPFISSSGLKLVLVDTPGPNNARNINHRRLTYNMFDDSEKSLVLFVMNYTQSGVDDEKTFLDYVCKRMKEGDKKERDRFMFVVNKVDEFKPKQDGEDGIEKSLKSTQERLEKIGIESPNIFPTSALAALEIRTNEEDPSVLDTFERRTTKYNAFKFNDYYQYSHLPSAVKEKIDKRLSKAEDNEKLEIYTGIVSVEEAIAQYIYKYARVTKIYDLVHSFNEHLNDIAAIEHIKDEISRDSEKKKALDQQIKQIKEQIEVARQAGELSKKIDNIDILPNVEKKIDASFKRINDQITKTLSSDGKVVKSAAIEQCKQIEKECKDLLAETSASIERIIKETYKEYVNKMVDEYKQHLNQLNINVDTQALTILNPIELVSANLQDMSTIIFDKVDENTSRVDESYDKKIPYEETVKGTRWQSARRGAAAGATTGTAIGRIGGPAGMAIGAGIGGLIGGIGGYFFGEDEHKITKYRTERIDKFVEYVDMQKVYKDYAEDIQVRIRIFRDQTTNKVIDEMDRIKEYMKEKMSEIDNLLKEKLDNLSSTEADSKAQAEEIAQKQKNLQWIESIQQEMNIINF